MSRRFRYDMPDPIDGVVRRRVQRVLRRRFEVAVVQVVAGAGFGKTWALTRAVAENALDPVGTDVWLGCEPADADAPHLLEGLAVALGARGTTRLADVLDVLAERGPEPTCLLLDDVHEIPARSSASAVLNELVDRMPPHVHLVLSARVEPPVALARLKAEDEVATITEDDLELRADETSALGVELSQVRAGWPALVALLGRAGRPSDFLWEEVLSTLSEGARSALRILTAVGRADGRLLAELGGPEALDEVRALPLVQHAAQSVVAHDLWVEHADLLGDEATRVDDRCRAVRHLLDRGETADAVEVALRGTPDDVLADALSTIVWSDRPSPPVLRAWADALPDALHRLGIGRLVRAMADFDEDSTATRLVEDFREAAATLRDEGGNAAAEAMALGQLVYCAYAREEPAIAVDCLPRLRELSDVEDEAAGIVALTDVSIALADDRPDDALDGLDRLRGDPLPSDLRVVADYLEIPARYAQGRPTVEAADRLLRHPRLLPGMTGVHVLSRLRAGRLFELRALLDDEVPDDQGRRAVHIWSSWRTAIAALLGEQGEAERFLDLSEATAPETGRSVFLLELNRTLVRAAGGDVDRLAADLRVLASRHPPASDRSNWYRGVGLLAWLDPASSAPWRVDGTGPEHRRDLAIGDLARAASDGELERAPPEPPTVEELAVAVCPVGAALVIAGLAAADDPAGPELATGFLDAYGPYGRRLLEEAGTAGSRDGPVPQAGAALVRALPARPRQPVWVGLLGPAVLHRAGEVAHHPDWRRDRVRSLLGYLVVHRRAPRTEVRAALWPDDADDAAQRNLRSTLNLLHRVLEPARGAGHAPWFVRADDEVLALGADGLDTDVWRFEAALSEADAAAATGDADRALTLRIDACSRYGGDFLVDARWDDWAVRERERLRRAFCDAALLAGDACADRGDLERALDLVERTIEVDPWSEPAWSTLVRTHLARRDRRMARRTARRALTELEEIGGVTDPALERLLVDLLGPSAPAT